jgi:hypothetical protein
MSQSLTSLSSEPVPTTPEPAPLVGHSAAVRTQLLWPTREHKNLRDGRLHSCNAINNEERSF